MNFKKVETGLLLSSHSILEPLPIPAAFVHRCLPNGTVVLLSVPHRCELGVPPCERRGHAVVAAVQEIPVVNKPSPGSCVGLMTASCWGQRVCPRLPTRPDRIFQCCSPTALAQGLKCRHPLELPGGPALSSSNAKWGTGLCCHPIPAAPGMSSGCYKSGGRELALGATRGWKE